MKKPDKFYLQTYRLLKILPKILVVLTALFFIYLAIENGEFSIVIMGAVATAIVYLLTTILIAPIILQTDALVEIQTHMADVQKIEEPQGPQAIPKNEYDCEKFEETGRSWSGKCSVCVKDYANLKLCYITSGKGLSQKYLCPSCIAKFKSNASK